MAGRISRGRDATIGVRAGSLRRRGGATAVATVNAVPRESGAAMEVMADAACSRGADAGDEAGPAGRAASVSAR
jgi:hypothetical protein